MSQGDNVRFILSPITSKVDLIVNFKKIMSMMMTM